MSKYPMIPNDSKQSKEKPISRYVGKNYGPMIKEIKAEKKLKRMPKKKVAGRK
jgi:hypothetical protein